MNKVKITPLLTPPLSAEINLPASKSILNRQLFMSALTSRSVEKSIVTGEADDVVLMHEVLLQIDNHHLSNGTTEIFCHNAATVFRMAASYATLKGGNYLFTGSAEMQKRPIGELANALSQLGANVSFTEKNGFPPLKVCSSGIKNNIVEVKSTESSQHISGLLMIGAVLPEGLSIVIDGNAVSRTYINLTIQLMKEAGAKVSITSKGFKVERTGYPLLQLKKHADWSAAAFFYAALSIMPFDATLLLKGLSVGTGQGDEHAKELFKLLGVNTESIGANTLIKKELTMKKKLAVNFMHHPDLFNAFAIASAIANTNASLSGLETLKYKESDRLANLTKGLEIMKKPYALDQETLSLPYTAGFKLSGNPYEFDSYNDHRIAMSYATIGVAHPVIITNPHVVSKSFPNFFNEIGKIANTINN